MSLDADVSCVELAVAGCFNPLAAPSTWQLGRWREAILSAPQSLMLSLQGARRFMYMTGCSAVHVEWSEEWRLPMENARLQCRLVRAVVTVDCCCPSFDWWCFSFGHSTAIKGPEQ